jgi:hypothetical protein
MSIRKLALVVATAALGLLSVGIGSASATTLNTDPGNIPFATGNVTVKNTSSGVATLTTGLGTITCNTTHFESTINNNHAATLPGTLNRLTFTSCSDTVPLLTVSSCHQHRTSPLAVSTTLVTLTDVTVRCNLAGIAQGCYFTAATAAGVVNNPASTLSYTNVNASSVNPTGDAFGFCPSSGTFSVVLNHIVEVGTNRTVTVV